MKLPEINLNFSFTGAPGMEPVQKHYSNWEKYVEGLANDYGVHSLPNPSQQAMLVRLTPKMDEESRKVVIEYNQAVVNLPLIGRQWRMGQFGWETDLGEQGINDLLK